MIVDLRVLSAALLLYLLNSLRFVTIQLYEATYVAHKACGALYTHLKRLIEVWGCEESQKSVILI